MSLNRVSGFAGTGFLSVLPTRPVKPVTLSFGLSASKVQDKFAPTRFHMPSVIDRWQYANGETTTVKTLIGGGQIFHELDTLFERLEKGEFGKNAYVYADYYNMQSPQIYPERQSPANVVGRKVQAELVNRLVKAKNSGHHVKTILDQHWDDRFSEKYNDRTVTFLHQAGIQAGKDLLRYPANSLIQYSHVKNFMIFNPETNQWAAIIGGTNWGNHSPTNHDAAVLIEGPDVRNLYNEIFVEGWQTSVRARMQELLSKDWYSQAVTRDKDEVQFDSIIQELAKLGNTAKWIEHVLQKQLSHEQYTHIQEGKLGLIEATKQLKDLKKFHEDLKSALIRLQSALSPERYDRFFEKGGLTTVIQELKNLQSGSSLPAVEPFTPKPEEARIKVLRTIPKNAHGGPVESIYEELAYQIDNAKNSIHMEQFVLTEKNLTAKLIAAHQRLTKAGKEGVKILVDPGIYFLFHRTVSGQVIQLAKAGIPIRFYKTDYANTEERLHAKWSVFDYQRLLIGSANMSAVGLRSPNGTYQSSREASILIDSNEIASAFAAQALQDYGSLEELFTSTSTPIMDRNPTTEEMELVGGDETTNKWFRKFYPLIAWLRDIQKTAGEEQKKMVEEAKKKKMVEKKAANNKPAPKFGMIA